MTNRVERITNYIFKPDDELLIDTNIWLFVHGPTAPGDRRVALYSKAFEAILKAKSTVYLDVLIISEFVNRYARLKHGLLVRSGCAPGDFKDFRRTAGFKQVALDISADVRRVVSCCGWMEMGSGSVDVGSVVDEFESGGCDFNDEILARLCRLRGLKLVTDDGDFSGQGLTVVTGNPSLFNR